MSHRRGWFYACPSELVQARMHAQREQGNCEFTIVLQTSLFAVYVQARMHAQREQSGRLPYE
jgi:hypothetical protein